MECNIYVKVKYVKKYSEQFGMIEHLNELIDLNLNMICSTEKKQIYVNRFIGINGEELGSKFECKLFSDEMESRGLIRRIYSLCIVEELGFKVFQSGGWLKHLEKDSIKKAEQYNKSNEREGL